MRQRTPKETPIIEGLEIEFPTLELEPIEFILPCQCPEFWQQEAATEQEKE